MASLLLSCRHRRSRAALSKFSASGFVADNDELNALLNEAIDCQWILSLDSMFLSLVLIEEAAQPSISCCPAGCYRADHAEVYKIF